MEAPPNPGVFVGWVGYPLWAGPPAIRRCPDALCARSRAAAKYSRLATLSLATLF